MHPLRDIINFTIVRHDRGGGGGLTLQRAPDLFATLKLVLEFLSVFLQIWGLSLEILLESCWK